MTKEYSIKKLNEKWYEMTTRDIDTEETVISSYKKETVEQTYNSLKEQRKRIENSISENVKALEQFNKAINDYGDLYTEEDIRKFNEIAVLTDAKNNLENVQGKIDAAKAMIDVINEQTKHIEGVIPELKRVK